jgi:hypothetical protein
MPSRTAESSRSPLLRSRISNGTALLPSGDGRSSYARRLRDLIQAHEAELGGQLTSGQHALVRRAAALQVELERIEDTFAAHDGVAPVALIETYQRAAGSLRRLLDSLGLLERRTDPPETAERRRLFARLQEAVEAAQ